MSLLDKYKAFKEARKDEVEKPADDVGFGPVLIIDGLNTYLRCFAATPTMNDDGDHVGGVTGFLLSIGATIRLFKPSRVVIIFDGAGGSQRRRKLFPDYKANRKNMTKLNRTYDFASLEEEKEAQKWQLKLLVGILSNLPVTVMSIDLIEADDAIGFLAKTIEKRGGKSIILSNDKDFLQLVNDNISVWNPIKKKLYRPDGVLADYGFHPTNFLIYRTVTGDKSDGIPGIEGIKEKTLIKYFPELAEPTERDLDFIMESAAAQVAGKKKPPVALVELLAHRDTLDRNIKLMRLDEAMMSGTTAMEVLERFEKGPNSYNKTELTKLIRFYKLMSAITNWETWLQSTFVPLIRINLRK